MELDKTYTKERYFESIEGKSLDYNPKEAEEGKDQDKHVGLLKVYC